MGKSYDDIINDTNGEKYIKWLMNREIKDLDLLKLIDYYKKVKNI